MELLIVILIVGLVFALSVGNFKKKKDEPQKLTLKTLKEYLQSFPHDKSVKILCLEDCSSCSIFVDGENVKEIEDFLDKSIELYRYDFYTGIDEQSREVYFNSEDVEKDVCFSYSVDKKGVGKQLIVKFKEKVYDFSTYLNPTPVYSSLEELVDAKESLVQEVLR